jgi:hypothetical protein
MALIDNGISSSDQEVAAVASDVIPPVGGVASDVKLPGGADRSRNVLFPLRGLLV